MRILAKALTLALCTALAASAAGPYSAQSMQKDMVAMEEGMLYVQKGFLYNNLSLIEQGVETLQKANQNYMNADNIEQTLPENRRHMKRFAVLEAERIDASSEEMLYYLRNKQMMRAADAYGSVVDACTKCHALVRGW